MVSSEIVPSVSSLLQRGERSGMIESYSIRTTAKIPTKLAMVTAAARFGGPTPPVLGLADDAELSAATLPLAVEPLVADATADEAALVLEADAANVALDEEFDVFTSPAEDLACVALLAVVAAEVALGRAESIPPATVAIPPNPEYVCR